MTSSGTEARERLVLDTSAFSRMRAGNERALDLVSAAEQLLLPTIVLGELEAGFALGRRASENRIALSEFLAEPFVSVLPVGPEVARRYGAVALGGHFVTPLLGVFFFARVVVGCVRRRFGADALGPRIDGVEVAVGHRPVDAVFVVKRVEPVDGVHRTGGDHHRRFFLCQHGFKDEVGHRVHRLERILACQVDDQIVIG